MFYLLDSIIFTQGMYIITGMGSEDRWNRTMINQGIKAAWSSCLGYLPIVFTTFTVNLRHLLMSSALTVYLRRASNGWITLFGYGVKDESFAFNMHLFRQGGWGWRQA